MNHNLKDLMKNKIFLTVPDRLNQLGKLFKKRGEIYGDNYHHFGTVLSGLFPNGLHLQTEEEHNRYALFLQLVHKLSRYANTIKTGGHKDSLDDFAVYSQMLAEFDELAEYKQGLDRTDPRDKKIKDLELEIRRLKNNTQLQKKAG
jgi:hypothetical protein